MCVCLRKEGSRDKGQQEPKSRVGPKSPCLRIESPVGFWQVRSLGAGEVIGHGGRLRFLLNAVRILWLTKECPRNNCSGGSGSFAFWHLHEQWLA